MFVFQVVMVSGRMSCVSGAWVGALVGVGVGGVVGVRMVCDVSRWCCSWAVGLFDLYC